MCSGADGEKRGEFVTPAGIVVDRRPWTHWPKVVMTRTRNMVNYDFIEYNTDNLLKIGRPCLIVTR